MQQEQDEIAANDLNNEALKLREEISALETKYTSMTNEILRSVAEYDQTVSKNQSNCTQIFRIFILFAG